MKAMKGMKRSSSKGSSGPPMKKMKAIKTKTPVELKLTEILKFLKDTENCPIEGPESGRQMLIKMAPFVLGKGAASDQRSEPQAKALADLEDVLRNALRSWYDKVKHVEDEVALAEEKKGEAQAAFENAEAMIAKSEEDISEKQAEVAEASKVEKEAAKALRKATGKGKTSSEDLVIAQGCAKEVEDAKAKVAALTETLKESQAAKKSLVAAQKDAAKDVAKAGKAVANNQGHLAVEQVGLEMAQNAFASFKALRDRKAKTPMKRKPKSDDAEEGTAAGERSPGGSFLDKVASSILGLSPKPEPKEEE